MCGLTLVPDTQHTLTAVTIINVITVVFLKTQWGRACCLLSRLQGNSQRRSSLQTQVQLMDGLPSSASHQPRDVSTQCQLLVVLHQPGQQGVDVVRSGRVRTQRRGCHKCSCLGPVLAPVMGSICTKAGSDGLSKHHVSYKG